MNRKETLEKVNEQFDWIEKMQCAWCDKCPLKGVCVFDLVNDAFPISEGPQDHEQQYVEQLVKCKHFLIRVKESIVGVFLVDRHGVSSENHQIVNDLLNKVLANEIERFIKQIPEASVDAKVSDFMIVD